MLCLSALSVGEYTEAHIHSSILYDRNLYRQSHEFCSSPYRYSLPWGLFSRRHTSLALPSEGFGKGGVKIRKLQKEKKKKTQGGILRMGHLAVLGLFSWLLCCYTRLNIPIFLPILG